MLEMDNFKTNTNGGFGMFFKKIINLLLFLTVIAWSNLTITKGETYSQNKSEIINKIDNDLNYLPRINLNHVNQELENYESFLRRTKQAYYGALGLAALGAIYGGYKAYQWFNTPPTQEEKDAYNLIKRIGNLTPESRNQLNNILNPRTSEPNSGTSPSVNPNANEPQSSWYYKPFEWSFGLGKWGLNFARQEFYQLPKFIATATISGLANRVSGPLVDKISEFALATHTISWFIHKKTQLNFALNNLISSINQIVKVKINSNEKNASIEYENEFAKINNKLFIENIEKTLGYLKYVLNNLPQDSIMEKNMGEHIFKTIIKLSSTIAGQVYLVTIKDKIEDLNALTEKISANIKTLTSFINLIKIIEQAINRSNDEEIPAIILKDSIKIINRVVTNV